MTKLALVLGGHASLGAYTAGATTEILTALRATGRRDGARVAVVAGSGSGGLSAALAARSLVVNGNLVPWIERVWVDGLDARHLLGSGRRDRASVLDPEPLEELTRHTIAGPPASDDRPLGQPDDPLRLGLDLVRAADGYGAGAEPGPDAPSAVFDLGPGHPAGHPVWEDVRRATIAAASVPGALPLHRLPPEAAELAGDGGPSEAPFVSGAGPARPRPLALARRLMRRHVGTHGEGWRVLVVDPRPGPPAAGGRSAPSDSPLRAAGLLLRAGLGDDIARDWSATEDARERAELLRALVRRLPEIHGRLDDPDAVGLGRRIGELAERVAERDLRRFGLAREDRTGDPALRRLDDSLRRIQGHPAYAPVFEDVESRAGRTRLAKLVYVLEALGDLQGADPARLHRVAPEAGDALAGRGLAGFGGFAARSWRRHDFVAGRRDARDVLEGPLSDVLPYSPDGPDAYDPPSVTGLDGAMAPGARRELRARLEEEADLLLGQVRPGGIRGLFYRLARPGARKALADAVEDALEAGALG